MDILQALRKVTEGIKGYVDGKTSNNPIPLSEITKYGATYEKIDDKKVNITFNFNTPSFSKYFYNDLPHSTVDSRNYSVVFYFKQQNGSSKTQIGVAHQNNEIIYIKSFGNNDFLINDLSYGQNYKIGYINSDDSYSITIKKYATVDLLDNKLNKNVSLEYIGNVMGVDENGDIVPMQIETGSGSKSNIYTLLLSNDDFTESAPGNSSYKMYRTDAIPYTGLRNDNLEAYSIFYNYMKVTMYSPPPQYAYSQTDSDTYYYSGEYNNETTIVSSYDENVVILNHVTNLTNFNSASDFTAENGNELIVLVRPGNLETNLHIWCDSTGLAGIINKRITNLEN